MSDAEALKKLYNIFAQKKWTSKFGHEVVYGNFCHLVANLNPEQKRLIVELTERYTWISEDQYPIYLNRVLNMIEPEKLDKIDKIILFPVFKPKDKDVTKSGNDIVYKFRSYRHYLQSVKDKIFHEVEKYEELLHPDFQLEEGTAIFVVDDYLGSGETIEETITEILKNEAITKDKISVIAIAAQKNSADYLSSINIPLYTGNIFKKGISEFYENPEKYDNIRTMQAIENMITGNEYPFGYKDSEALITMMRTPDNTFPIFWKEHRKGTERFAAPFTRNE